MGALKPRSKNCTLVTCEAVRYYFSYDPETGIFRWKNCRNNSHKNGERAGSVRRGRRRLSVDHHLFFASNIAWLYVYGVWPQFEIDHINRNTLDDSIGNLRDVPQVKNAMNATKHCNNTSGFKGVQKSHYQNQESGWMARIRADGIRYNLGVYPTAEMAAGAYRIAAAGMHGQYSGIG